MPAPIKPLMTLDELVLDDIEDESFFSARSGQINDRIGARQLGYNLTELPPGKAQCPFHSHRGEEEMLLVLEGGGQLRFGVRRYPVRKHDIIACPAGGPEVAHQLINTGSTLMRCLALSTRVPLDVCEYPDSDKLMVLAGRAAHAPCAKCCTRRTRSTTTIVRAMSRQHSSSGPH